MSKALNVMPKPDLATQSQPSMAHRYAHHGAPSHAFTANHGAPSHAYTTLMGAGMAVCWFGAPLPSLDDTATASPAGLSFSCCGTIAEPRISGACESGMCFWSTAIGSWPKRFFLSLTAPSSDSFLMFGI